MSSYTNCLEKFDPGLNLFSNISSEPKMGSAFIESPSNQLYPKISNSVQFTNQDARQNVCRGPPTQSHDALDSYQASSVHSFLKDWISLFASSPCELNQKSAFKHGCDSTGILNRPSNGLLEPQLNQPEVNQTFSFQTPLENSVEVSCLASGKLHKKPKGSKKKNNVQTIGKVNKVWWEILPARRQWSNEEDMLLVQQVKQHGERNWTLIAEKFPLRAGKQCRDRWLNYLRPNITKTTWSEEDDKVLIELHKQFGNKWACIAKMLPGRSENSIKNHWNATKRRQSSSKKRRRLSSTNNDKIKHPSLLKTYITRVTSSSPDDQLKIQQKPSESSTFDPNDHQPLTSFPFDSEIGYKPEMVVHEDECGFDLVDDLVDQLRFDPTAEMEFLDVFCR